MRTKVQISLDNRLMKRIDDYCRTHYISRSQFIALACACYLDEPYPDSMARVLNELMAAANRGCTHGKD